MTPPRPDWANAAWKTSGAWGLQEEGSFYQYFGVLSSEQLLGCSPHLFPESGTSTPSGKHRSKHTLLWITPLTEGVCWTLVLCSATALTGNFAFCLLFRDSVHRRDSTQNTQGWIRGHSWVLFLLFLLFFFLIRTVRNCTVFLAPLT